MTEKRVLFFIPSTKIAEDGVSESFVLGHLRHLQDLGYKCMLIASANTINSAESTANDLLTICGIKAHISGKYRNGVVGYSKIRNGWRIFLDYKHEIELCTNASIHSRTS